MTDTSSHAIASMRAICLENIKTYAEWIKNDAESLQRYSSLLSSLPDYETEAEFAIALAWATLERTMRGVVRAHEELTAKRDARPIFIESHTADSFTAEADDEQLRYETETGAAHA
jgi:hypothetical protein